MNSELGDDDWQNIEIPDELIDFPETIKNKEKELKELEDRKLVEESELPLLNELFTTKTNDIISKEPITKEPITKEPITNIKHKKRKIRKGNNKKCKK
jgi:hypothetical protein